MLRTRIVTALILLALVVPALAFLPASGWALFVLAFVAAAAWEWARLCGLPQALSLGYAALTAAAGIAVLLGVREHEQAVTLWVYAISVTTWGGIAGCWFFRGPAAPRGGWLAALGWLVLIPCWWAVVQARMAGALFMFLLMGLIWVADIGAYFAGRRFGRHKLAPAVSPGKTWEGVAGAMVGAGLLALLCAVTTSANGGPLDSWFAWIFGYAGRHGAPGVLVALLTVCAVVGLSILGDLFESLLKRRADVKDSSALLPGHGGVLDRIDSLIPAMPLAMLIFSFVRSA